MNDSTLTIGRLARAAGVGVETVRYYQRRELLPVPPAGKGTFRAYPPETVDRLRFIRRAQQLGFSLDEIATLLRLEDGKDRETIRAIAADKRASIHEKIADLQRMEAVLAQLVCECEASTTTDPCPIIAAFSEDSRHLSTKKS